MNEDQKESQKNLPKGKNHLKSNLLNSSEGHIFLTGALLGVLYVSWLALNGFWDPKKSQVFVTMTVTHILSGRAAGMFYGYSAKLGHSIVIPVNILIETIAVLIFYPLFVFSWRQLLVSRTLRSMMNRTRKTAEANRHLIRKYGLVGLFVFVWIPFWMTGPLIGCVIGFLLDIHPWLNVSVVLVGSYVAIASWALLLRRLHDRIATFSPYAPMIIVAGLLVMALGGHLIHIMRKNHHNEDNT